MTSPTDHRDIVMVAGVDPYAASGTTSNIGTANTK